MGVVKYFAVTLPELKLTTEERFVGPAGAPKYREAMAELETKGMLPSPFAGLFESVLSMEGLTLITLSMLIAYMIMRHGAEILKVFSGGIVGIGKMMLGIGAPI